MERSNTASAPAGPAEALNSLVNAAVEASQSLADSATGLGSTLVSAQGTADSNTTGESSGGPVNTDVSTIGGLLTSTLPSQNTDAPGSSNPAGATNAAESPAQDLSQEAIDALEDRECDDTSPTTPTKENQSDIVDIADTPVKRKPPWMIVIDESPMKLADFQGEVPRWFSDSLPPTYEEPSPKLKSIIAVEKQIRKRFPKCQPMIPDMIEFLSQTTDDQDNIPLYHPHTLLSDEYATALPLVYFSNLIFSKALLINIAGRSFKSSRPKNKSHHQEPLKLWGMKVPLCEDNQHTYQFWVVHLKGRNGVSYNARTPVNERTKFHKFETSLIKFFDLQFDAMREDEKQNVRDGLVGDCETIYIAGFNLLHPNTISIVAAVQFCTSPEGAWINWLGISADIRNSGDISLTNGIGVFRRLGFGMFLQNIVQFQQLARGWLPRLFLQTILDGEACEYYSNRGYIKALRNDIESIPSIRANPFVEKHWNFVTDEKQNKEGTNPKSYLALFFRDGFVVTTYLGDDHSFFFLEGANRNCLPKNDSDLMFRFPYNSSGSELEDNLGDGALQLFFQPRSGKLVEEYVLPENTPKHGFCKLNKREINQFERHFDSADVAKDEYIDMKEKPKLYLRDQTMAFWGGWLQRNPNSVASQDAAIVQPYITKEVIRLFELLESPGRYNEYFNSMLVASLDKIDKYLYGHPDLIQKRLIFFVVNQERHHWYGFCAINPWKVVVMALRKRNVEGLHSEFTNKKILDHRAGILHSDSLNSKKGPPEFKHVRPFLWLLNMISHYRDLKVSDNRENINFVKMHQEETLSGLHMYMVGMDGPFGNLFLIDMESMPLPFLDRDRKVVFMQPNGYDCGLCWGLFVYDTLLAFEHRPFLEKETCVEDASN